MPQFFQDNIPLLQRDTGTQISMPATYNGQLARARVAGQGYRWSSALACNLATTGLGGLDTGSLAANTLYHVYLCVSSNIVGLVVSANGPSTGPTGFSQNRYVGRLRTQSGSANVAELAVVNVIVGSGDELPYANTTEWVSFTPQYNNITLGTGGGNTGRWRRVGDTMEFQGLLILGTGGDVAGIVETRLPAGFTVNTTAAPVNSTSTFGGCFCIDDNTNTRYVLVPFVRSTTSIAFQPDNVATIASTTVPMDWTTADQLWFAAIVPITEWQGLFS